MESNIITERNQEPVATGKSKAMKMNFQGSKEAPHHSGTEGVTDQHLGTSTSELRTRIKDAESRTQIHDNIWWAKLMLDVLESRPSPAGTLDPADPEPNSTSRVFKSYITQFKGDEAEELDIILAWVTRASRPFSLQELTSALQPSTPNPEEAMLPLGERICHLYSAVLKLVRGDGIYTGCLDCHPASILEEPLLIIPSDTKVHVAHPVMTEYLKNCTVNAANGTLSCITTRDLQWEAGIELKLLKTCLERLSAQTWSSNNCFLKTYAAESWLHHLHRFYAINEELSADDHQFEQDTNLLSLLRNVLTNERNIRWWCNHYTCE
jgi:hypothetical protein